MNEVMIGIVLFLEELEVWFFCLSDENRSLLSSLEISFSKLIR